MTKSQKAIFAAGCFWGVEKAFYKTPGVLETRVGYTGGDFENPKYEDVLTHKTGHAEAIEITYDPEKISYNDLLNIFWKIHNPTTPDRQGPDIGSNYRSAIFYLNEEQKKEAELSKKEASKKYDAKNKKIVTEISKAKTFWPAEDYHQKYFLKNPEGTCPV